MALQRDVLATRKEIAIATHSAYPQAMEANWEVLELLVDFLPMSGSFRTFPLPGPKPREKTCLRLENKKEKVVAHLSASVCVHGDIELYRKRIAELGPDPLRDDADKEIVWSKMQILFVIGVHPDQRASTLTRSNFEELWSQSVRLLRVEVDTGSITTVSPEEAGANYHFGYKAAGDASNQWISSKRHRL